MKNYISSEYLKHKNTFAKKLVWLASILTLCLNILAPMWYQQNSYNWWYVFLYPGCLTLLSILIIQRDNGKLKFRAILSLPVDLKKAWYAKIITCIIYIVLANTILMLCNVAGGFIIQHIFDIPMTISPMQALFGTLCIILASIWNIPLCLWFTKKVGVFATLILNVGMSFMLGTLGANTSFWFICPYSWVTRLMVPTLGILPNGESVTGSALSTPLPLVIMTICLSLLLLYTISKSTAKSFIKQEVL